LGYALLDAGIINTHKYNVRAERKIRASNSDAAEESSLLACDAV
jgi:hypothetical protein